MIILANGQQMEETWVGQTRILIPLPPENQLDPPIISELIDEEKAAMAEAIIDLETRLSEMEARINA